VETHRTHPGSKPPPLEEAVAKGTPSLLCFLCRCSHLFYMNGGGWYFYFVDFDFLSMEQLINSNNKLFWMFGRQLVLLAIDLNFEKYKIYFLLPSHFNKRHNKLNNVSPGRFILENCAKAHITYVPHITYVHLTFKMQEKTKIIWGKGSLAMMSPKQIMEAINRFVPSKHIGALLTLALPKGWKHTYSYTIARNPSVKKCAFPEVCCVRVTCILQCSIISAFIWVSPCELVLSQ